MPKMPSPRRRVLHQRRRQSTQPAAVTHGKNGESSRSQILVRIFTQTKKTRRSTSNPTRNEKSFRRRSFTILTLNQAITAFFIAHGRTYQEAVDIMGIQLLCLKLEKWLKTKNYDVEYTQLCQIVETKIRIQENI